MTSIVSMHRHSRARFFDMKIGLRRLVSAYAETLFNWRRSSRDLHLDSVKNFFSGRWQTSDVESGFYGSIASTILRKYIPHDAVRIVDLGCGRSFRSLDILREIAPHAFHIGVDIAIDDKLGLDEHIFTHEMGMVEYLRCFHEPIDVAIFSNSLCFLDHRNLHLTFELLTKRSAYHVIVIEPWPSTFWDPRFGEFTAVLREPRIIEDTARAAGYVTDDYVLCGKRICFDYIMPIVTVLVFQLGKT